jgi:hypothetical protein
MSLLSRFARSKDSEVAVAEVATCAHVELAPRWDSAADMGRKDKITTYQCSGCKESFSPDDVENMALV